MTNIPTIYAVWIRGKGWLRTSKGDVLADVDYALARAAADFFGNGLLAENARVVPFDDAMLDLEQTFLEAERGWLGQYITNSIENFYKKRKQNKQGTAQPGT